MLGVDAFPESTAQVDAFTVQAKSFILESELTQTDTLGGFSDDFAVQ